ncbi:hypothetical protein OF83DRAFT_502247 [Amylostereum chailletii]|nr:hypothetical protein OF83DRAFT_502247 [Amylostereum chailletii]
MFTTPTSCIILKKSPCFLLASLIIFDVDVYCEGGCPRVNGLPFRLSASMWGSKSGWHAKSGVKRQLSERRSTATDHVIIRLYVLLLSIPVFQQIVREFGRACVLVMN